MGVIKREFNLAATSGLDSCVHTKRWSFGWDFGKS